VSVKITALFPSKLTSLPHKSQMHRGNWPRQVAVPNEGKKSLSSSSHDNYAQAPSNPTNVRRLVNWNMLIPVVVLIGGVILLLLLAKSKRFSVQRPGPPVAASITPTAAKLETIPGSLRVTIGPDEQTIAPLAKNRNWAITKGSDGKFILTDISNHTNATSAPATAPKVAATTTPPAVAPAFVELSFANTTALLAEADSGFQFTELQGTAANQCDSRTLKVEPGKRVLCRIQPADASSKIRFEIVYDSRDQKARGA
jgi:hypothetical protein